MGILDSYIEGLGVQKWGPDWREKKAQLEAETANTQARTVNAGAELEGTRARTRSTELGMEGERIGQEEARIKLEQLKADRASTEALVASGQIPEGNLIAHDFAIKEAERKLKTQGAQADIERTRAQTRSTDAQAGLYRQKAQERPPIDPIADHEAIQGYVTLSRQRGMPVLPTQQEERNSPGLRQRVVAALGKGPGLMNDAQARTTGVLGQIQSVRSLLKSEKTGPMANIEYWSRANIPGVPEPRGTQSQLATTLASLKNTIIKEITGAAMSEHEVPRLTLELPQLGDKPSVRDAKLNALEARLLIVQKVRRGEISREQGIEMINAGSQGGMPPGPVGSIDKPVEAVEEYHRNPETGKLERLR